MTEHIGERRARARRLAPDRRPRLLLGKDGQGRWFLQWGTMRTYDVGVGVWQTPTLLNGWAHADADSEVRYRFAPGNNVEFKGRLDPSSATSQHAMTLLAAFRPPATRQTALHQGGTQDRVTRLTVSTAGEVVINAPVVHGSAGLVSGLDGFAFNLTAV